MQLCQKLRLRNERQYFKDIAKERFVERSNVGRGETNFTTVLIRKRYKCTLLQFVS